MSSRPLAPLLLCVGLATACAAGGDFTPCVSGADCPSGVCNADGTCEDPAASSSGAGAGSSSSSTTAPASTSSTSSGGGGAGSGGGAVVCSPNQDGTITRLEVPLAAGLHATFRAAENVTVDTAGDPQPDGSRAWDFTAMLGGDHDEIVETQDPNGQWFASDFAGATYAARLSDTQNLLGVFQVTDSALLLLGVVSPTNTPPSTELTYDPPVQVLSFPMQDASSWTTTSTVTGFAQSTPVFYTEKYDSSVDAHGDVKTPFASFKALRVRTDLTRTVGALVTFSHQFGFVTECFGTVATVNSKTDELADEFTMASEIARLSP